MGLYERIRDVAKTKGYSINRLEQELGFARSSINKYNKNAPSADKLKKIAVTLGVSVDFLMTGKESPEKEKLEIADSEKKYLQYARRLLDLGIDPDALETLIDTIEKMQKKD
jgi:transcriptional regulator with XRE-family HTH domain